ncbi:MAG TPA: hypothetical protein VKX28_14545 [Xanthobacteraceae bacterium]|nr:hypothetical protein [Xanthobacteraceae bacterium]
MRRRDFIVGGLAIAGQTVVPARAARAPIRRLIDAHCHLFNARDLPIEGFTKKVLRRGPGYLNGFSASISGASARVRLPSGGAAG